MAVFIAIDRRFELWLLHVKLFMHLRLCVCCLVSKCESCESVYLLAGLLEVLTDYHSVLLSLIRKSAQITPFPRSSAET